MRAWPGVRVRVRVRVGVGVRVRLRLTEDSDGERLLALFELVGWAEGLDDFIHQVTHARAVDATHLVGVEQE